MRGYNLNGTIEWYGEEDDDKGCIEVVNNNVKTKVLVTSYEYTLILCRVKNLIKR